MIGIEAIASYIPTFLESNFAKKEQFGIDDAFIESKIGVHTVSRKADDEETSDMCIEAFRALRGKVPESAQEVDCIIVCTQNPDGKGLPHTSAIVHGKIGADDECAAFDISLGCSGYVYSLSVITSFMSANGMRKGLLFTADPYSKIVDPNDKNTSLLFGDAATVTLLGESPVFEISQTAFGTRGKDHEALQCLNGRLKMNGRGIFNFAMTDVPPQIMKLMDSGGHVLDEIDLFILHQGSRYMIEMLSKRLKLDAQKVPIRLAEQGNTVSSSIPLILEEYIDQSAYKNIVISGFGVGLSWASGILRRVKT